MNNVTQMKVVSDDHKSNLCHYNQSKIDRELAELENSFIIKPKFDFEFETYLEYLNRTSTL